MLSEHDRQVVDVAIDALAGNIPEDVAAVDGLYPKHVPHEMIEYSFTEGVEKLDRAAFGRLGKIISSHNLSSYTTNEAVASVLWIWLGLVKAVKDRYFYSESFVHFLRLFRFRPIHADILIKVLFPHDSRPDKKLRSVLPTKLRGLPVQFARLLRVGRWWYWPINIGIADVDRSNVDIAHWLLHAGDRLEEGLGDREELASDCYYAITAERSLIARFGLNTTPDTNVLVLAHLIKNYVEKKAYAPKGILRLGSVEKVVDIFAWFIDAVIDHCLPYPVYSDLQETHNAIAIAIVEESIIHLMEEIFAQKSSEQLLLNKSLSRSLRFSEVVREKLRLYKVTRRTEEALRREYLDPRRLRVPEEYLHGASPGSLILKEEKDG